MEVEQDKGSSAFSCCLMTCKSVRHAVHDGAHHMHDVFRWHLPGRSDTVAGVQRADVGPLRLGRRVSTANLAGIGLGLQKHGSVANIMGGGALQRGLGSNLADLMQGHTLGQILRLELFTQRCQLDAMPCACCILIADACR